MTEVRKSMNGFLYDRDLSGKVKARTDFISTPKPNNLPGFKNIRKLMSGWKVRDRNTMLCSQV